ncbi:MAG: hypothetical protein AAGG51_21930 [Cyanobacteria bacterium P01_G01_bin.54]
MISVESAINEAVNRLRSIPEASPVPFFDVRLEEVELVEQSEGEDYWLVTLGYTIAVEVPLDEDSGNFSFPGLPEIKKSHERVYKTFHIDAMGKFKAMKMRIV